MTDFARGMIAILMIAYLPLTLPQGWSQFVSAKHFAVEYPSDWTRVDTSVNRLFIRRGKIGAEGVIIKPGQAFITVEAAQGPSSGTLDGVITDYTKQASVLSRKSVPNVKAAHSCRQLKEVISTEPLVPVNDAAGPVPYMIDTQLFCEAENRVIVVGLRNYRGDKRQSEYRQLAVRMAKSLRLLH